MGRTRVVARTALAGLCQRGELPHLTAVAFVLAPGQTQQLEGRPGLLPMGAAEDPRLPGLSCVRALQTSRWTAMVDLLALAVVVVRHSRIVTVARVLATLLKDGIGVLENPSLQIGPDLGLLLLGSVVETVVAVFDKAAS